MWVGEAIRSAWPYLGGVLLTAIGMAPPLTYLWRGLPVRRKQVVNNFDPQTIRFYFARFWVIRQTTYEGKSVSVRDLDPEVGKQAELLVESLKEIFEENFGRPLFWPPMVLLACVLMISSTLALSKQAGLDLADSGATVAAAAAGGYLWVVGDGIRRMRLNDYLPSDVYDHVLRITIAVPLGLALATIAKDAVGPLIAFGAGTFPIEAISRILRSVVAKATGTTDDVDTDGDEIKRLVGINNDVAHRLMAEGVATILALCKCDPIRIMMRTNLDFEVVLDLMDQALVAAYLTASDRVLTDKLLDVLRLSGLARASQIVSLMEDARKGDATAGGILASLPGQMDLSEFQLRFVMA